MWTMQAKIGCLVGRWWDGRLLSSACLCPSFAGGKNIQVLAGEFVYRGDEPYCFDCVRRECAHCHKPISTTNVVIEIGGGDLVHERCFKCAECATTLVGKECFQNAEDAFLCESCNVAYIANSVGDPTQSVVRDCLSVLVGLSACVCL